MRALREISGFHQRAVICLSFSADGLRLASIGRDNSHCIAIYESPTADWASPKPLAPPCTDKGHNSEIFEAKFNPVTDHIVACGERFLRFFGLKDDPSPTESRIWAKKGILQAAGTKKDMLTDLLCLAFGPDGASYGGTLSGDIYVFHEQALTRHFAAHREGVTALWFDTSAGVNRLFSSGHDGLVKAWAISDDPRTPPRTASSAKLRWATEIDGSVHDGVIDLVRALARARADTRTPARQHARAAHARALYAAAGRTGPRKAPVWARPSLDPHTAHLVPIAHTPSPRSPSHPHACSARAQLAWVTPGLEAAAHAIHSANGSVVVGTISNEIYELDMAAADGSPMCIMQGHFHRRAKAGEPRTRRAARVLAALSSPPHSQPPPRSQPLPRAYILAYPCRRS